MSLKDLWCSKHALKERAEGMYRLESKKRKIIYAAVFITGFIPYIILGALHAERSTNASKINSDFEKLFSKTNMTAYDSCLLPTFKWDPEATD